MNSYLDLIGIYGKVHRKKNRMTLLCIVLAVSLVTAVFGLAEMEIRAQTISQIRMNGNWHVSFQGLGEEAEKLIGSRADVAVSGRIVNIPGDAGYSIGGKPLAVVGADEAISTQMGLAVTEGRFPQAAGECLLARQALEQFSLTVGQNAAVTLPDGSTRSYKIAGTFGDFSSLKKEGVHGMVIGWQAAQGLADREKSHFYVQFKPGTDMNAAIEEIKSAYRLSEDQCAENSALLGLAGQSRESYAFNLYLTAGVLFLLVLIAGVLMISSSFNTNLTERTRFFGLMRCLGASGKQVRRFMLLEGMRYSLRGIPAGLLAGTVLVWASCAFLKYVNPAFFSDMPLFGFSRVSLVCGIVLGFATVLLASLSPAKKAARVSPLSAATGNLGREGAPQPASAARPARCRVETAMGIRHALESKRNLLLMTGSFAVSIILYLSFGVTVDFMKFALVPLRPSTPDLSIASGGNTLSLAPSLLEEVESSPGVLRAYGRMFAYGIPAETKEESGKIDLVSYEANQFGWAKGDLLRGGLEAVETRAGSAAAVDSPGSPWRLGDLVMLDLPGGKKQVRIDAELSSAPYQATAGSSFLICSEKTFVQLAGSGNYTVVDIQLAKDADEDAVNRLRGLAGPQMRFSDRRQSNQEGITAFYTYAVFLYGFLAIIALITVFNIFNSIGSSVSSRMNQYGMMRAVGMAGSQRRRTVRAEAFTYAVCGCAAGCILGLAASRVLFGLMITARWNVAWQPPFGRLAVIAGISVLSALLATAEPVKRMNRMDIVSLVDLQ